MRGFRSRPCAPLNRDWFCSDSMSSLRTSNMNFPLTILINFSSTVALIVLFVWSTKYIFAEDGEGGRWKDADGNWQFEVKGEEEVLLDLGFLLFTNLLVFVKTCKVFNRHYDRMDVGGLAGCTFMFAQMLFVSFWYMLNIEARDGEQDNQNNQNNYYWAMDEEERRLYDQKVVAYVSLALAVLYSMISFSVYCEGVAMPELHPEDTSPWQRQNELDIAKGAVRLDMLSNIWVLLAPTTVLTFLVLLISASCSLLGEGGDRLREEGDIFNLIAVLAWLFVTSFGLAILGRSVLGRMSSDGTLAIGLLAGGGEYFAGLLLLVAIMYFSPLGDRGPDDAPIAAVATSFACLLLSSLHLGFSLWTKKYKRSISSAIPIEEEEGYIGHDDFVHVQGGDMVLA
eukprot:CCRYP_005602-RA/>CCRYP_005602-RA protein AED:0.09 eAED:0.09 QI:1713/1/1/1/0.5/0.33/3/394/396